MIKKTIIILPILFCINALIAQQFFAVKKYPKGSFGNPVKIPVSLAGNFGECRPNHFHSGLDVRTNKVENIPIYSIGDGFVSRIKIEAGGFGNAIYITHPNGFTSLYAHLNLFYPELERYVRHNQYQQKSWKIDLVLPPHNFPVRKGQFIAYSGNTGSSQAPHLHMEIRDAKTDKPLNGLLFYNYPDTKKPLLKKLAVYDLTKSIYDQQPKQINIVNNKLGSDSIITNSNIIGLGIVADDPMENALGVLGIYEMNLFVDDKAYFGWQLDNISYDETRYMNAMADYKVKKNGGPWIQLCYKQDGDMLNIYKDFTRLNGKIVLDDGQAHKIKIVGKDVSGNQSEVQFWLRSNLTQKNTNNYILKCLQENKYNDNTIAFTLPKTALYDDLPFINSIKPSNNPYSHLYTVHTTDVPIHDYFDLKLKPKTSIPASLANKVALVRYPFGKDTDKKGKGGKLENGWAVANVRDFGTYEIVIDQTAPNISTTLSNGATLKNKKIVIVAKDETTSVKDFTATINGQWIRCVQKGNTYTYEIDGYCAKGNNTLQIQAIDENNNTASKTIQFIY